MSDSRIRAEISRNIRQYIVLKEQADVATLAGIAARTEAVKIIPAILMERIGNQRRTQQELDLAFGHAGLEAIYHGLVDMVSLPDIYFVEARHR